MRLIHVRTFLDVEEGRVDPDAIVLKDLVDEDLAQIKYGILSHCWYHPREEVQYNEMDALIRIGGVARRKLRQRSGYQKIHRGCEQAWKDCLAWLWIDTCCINKVSSAELSEALNSMFRWYENSARCYVFLHDLDAKILPTTSNAKMFPDSSGWPRWFSRGWTLQDLIAPNHVHFFNKDWHFIGDKENHAQTLSSFTRIPPRVLRYGLDAHRPSAAQIMSWAADRRTTRTEDRAYSLMGLFGVHMPTLYGEGKNAFRRLQLEIIRMTNDHSIFAWDRKDNGWSGSVLADDPSFFRDCHDIVNMEPDEYLAALKGVVLDDDLSAVNEESIRTYTVTNAGIRIRLPIQRCRGSQSVFEARLACCRSFDYSPIPIFLVSFKTTYYRYFGQSQTIRGATATFQPLYLVYREEKQNDFTFTIDDRALECEGFVRRCVFPKRVPVNFKDNSITLSDTHNCAVIVYANMETVTCFALAVGYCSGYEWLHVIPDTPQQFHDVRQTTPDLWDSYAQRVCDYSWIVSPKHAPRIARACTPGVSRLYGEEDGPRLVKHTHLPKSIRGVQVMYQRLPQPNTCFVTVDITRCTGCCASPDVWRTLDGLSTNDFDMPCLMLDPTPLNTQVKRSTMHRFLVDGVPTSFLSAVAERDEIKKPLLWREEKADEGTRSLFDHIRMNFSMLLPFVRSAVIVKAEAAPTLQWVQISVGKGARDQVAIDFFRNIFGGGRFRGYIGEISFSELSRAIDDPGTHATVSTSQGSNEKIQKAEITRVVALAETLMKRMPLDHGGPIDQNLWGEEKIKMYHEAEELKSTSFGLQLLHVISTSYHRSSEGSVNGKHDCIQPQDIGIIRSLIQDARTLEAKLNTVEDEEEKRALEEDIIGKILLACWRGVRSEIEKILSRVANHIVTDARVVRDDRKQRFKLLREVGDVFNHATNDDCGESRGCHLRRIVVDAEENISKYELLLASRTAPRVIPTRQRDAPLTEGTGKKETLPMQN